MRYSKVKEKIKLDGQNEVEVGRIYNVWHTTAKVNTWIDARKDDDKGKNANKWSHQINDNGLQTYRTDNGTATGNKENTYYAVHGNGYGSTTTVAENVAPVSDIGVQSIPTVPAAVLNRLQPNNCRQPEKPTRERIFKFITMYG